MPQAFERASLTDPLTGVTNRRGFFQMGERLLARARFAKEPARPGHVDIDRFKAINDKFGHASGDEVLIAFCRFDICPIATNDLFGRIGGEEFATLLPQSASEAVWLAERVRAAVETPPILWSSTPFV